MKIIEVIEQPNSIELLLDVRKNGELFVPANKKKTYRSAISDQIKNQYPDRKFQTKVVTLEDKKYLKIKRIA